VRRYQDAQATLAELNRQHDEMMHARAGNDAAPNESATAELEKKIADAQAAMADADAALQAASPNYGQLVQQVAPASDVLAALAPDEAFVSITLSETGGWTFLLHDGKISVSRIDGGLPRIAGLVRRVRGSIESDSATLPQFDVAAAREINDAVLGGLGPAMEGVQALVVAPTGPLLSLPFGLLLTGPADPAKLADAPWLLRRATIAHVPAAANFISLRKIAGGSRGHHPWFGFGDFRPTGVL
jgi:hypothetical protein